MSMLYEVIIRATGEVRDADGNLISSTPVEGRMTATAAELHGLTPEQLRAAGLSPEHVRQITEGDTP
jgi:hypothetical protein